MRRLTPPQLGGHACCHHLGSDAFVADGHAHTAGNAALRSAMPLCGWLTHPMDQPACARGFASPVRLSRAATSPHGTPSPSAAPRLAQRSPPRKEYDSGPTQAAFDCSFGKTEVGGDTPNGPIVDVERLPYASMPVAEPANSPTNRCNSFCAVRCCTAEHSVDVRGIEKLRLSATIVVQQEVSCDGLKPGQRAVRKTSPSPGRQARKNAS